MGATTLAFNAYALTGERRYRDWLVDYIEAWVERTEANGGIIPSNIGLDGSIGGECDGKWYGGVYGWGFSVYDPASGKTAHRRSATGRAPYSFANALLMTGDRRYVDVWRGVIEAVNANAKTVDGRQLFPQMHGDDGWYEFSEAPFDDGALQVYYWSMDPADRKRVTGSGWLDFLDGRNPDYPVDALKGDLETVRSRMEGVRADTASPDTRMSDDMNSLQPAITAALTELMLGGLPTGREGHPLHARLRYFDPERRRAGVPEDVAALVTRMTDAETSVTLVNVNQVEARTGSSAGRRLRRAPVLDGQRQRRDSRRRRQQLRRPPRPRRGRGADAHHEPLPPTSPRWRSPGGVETQRPRRATLHMVIPAQGRPWYSRHPAQREPLA